VSANDSTRLTGSVVIRFPLAALVEAVIHDEVFAEVLRAVQSVLLRHIVRGIALLPEKRDRLSAPDRRPVYAKAAAEVRDLNPIRRSRRRSRICGLGRQHQNSHAKCNRMSHVNSPLGHSLLSRAQPIQPICSLSPTPQISLVRM